MISLALFFFFDFENTLPTLRFSCIMEMGIVAFNFNWICFLTVFSKGDCRYHSFSPGSLELMEYVTTRKPTQPQEKDG